MEIIPAIDIRGGRCVRLRQGDYDAETVFDADPVAAAQRWIDAGAARLHAVDLDGARAGAPRHFDILSAIARLGTPLQVGGGIRSAATAARYREAGVDRLVLGTAAIRDLPLVEALCREHGAAIVVSLDARDGRLAADGWTTPTRIDVLALARTLADSGVPRLIYTDIERDGTLTAPNADALRRLIAAVPIPVIASGGVAEVQHLAELAATGAEAAIVGRALYDGAVDLAAAIAFVREAGR